MKTPKAIPSASILVVRWIYGKKEKDEIAEIRQACGRNLRISAVRAKCKEDVYQSLTSWLKTPSAQIVYIGAHGSRRGLMDRRTKASELMEWGKLGSCLESVPEAFNHPVALVLGACYSSLAPVIWTRLKQKVPVSHIFCIAEEPYDKDAVALIVAILENVKRQRSLAITKQGITYLDEDVRDLLAKLPRRLNLRLFLKGDRRNKYAFVEINNLDDQSKVQQALEARRSRRKTSALESAVREGLAASAPSNLEIERLRAEAKKLNRVAIDDKDGLLPTRTLPKQSSTDQRRARKTHISTK